MTRNRPALDAAVRRALCDAVYDTPGQEVCGFLVERQSTMIFRRLPNLGGAGEFWIDRSDVDRVLRDIARDRGVVTAFIHTHGSSLELSAPDQASLRNDAWPWLVLVCRGAEIDGRWYWVEAGQIRSQSW